MKRWFRLIAEGIRSFLIMGRDEQSFLDAAWLRWLLAWTPVSWRHWVALWILSLSPHYFYRNRPEYRGKSFCDFLAAEEERNRTSRVKIYEQILAPYLNPQAEVIDLGCGPGFLARVVAPQVKRIYALDISSGVLACARVINNAVNILYLRSDSTGYAQVPEGTIDVAYSFAVIQHLREDVIRELFRTIAKKLHPDGRCVFQVQLEEPNWKPEAAWVQDQSLPGRIKYKYALHCFPRTEGFFQVMAKSAGLEMVSLQPLSKILSDPFDAIYDQHLLVLKKVH